MIEWVVCVLLLPLVLGTPYSTANYTLIAHVNVLFDLPFLALNPLDAFCQGGAPMTTMAVIITSLPTPPVTFGTILVNGTPLTNADLPFTTNNPADLIQYIFGPTIYGQFRLGNFNYLCDDGISFSALQVLDLIVITPVYQQIPYNTLSTITIPLPDPPVDNPIFILSIDPDPNNVDVYASQSFDGNCNSSQTIENVDAPVQLINLDGLFCFFYNSPLSPMQSGQTIVAEFTVTYQLNSDLEPLQIIVQVYNYLFAANQTDSTALLDIPLQLQFVATDTRTSPPPAETVLSVIVLSFPDPSIGTLALETSPGVFTPLTPGDLGVPFPVDNTFLSPIFLQTPSVIPGIAIFQFQMQIDVTGWLSNTAFMGVIVGATQVQPNASCPTYTIVANDNGQGTPVNISIVAPDAPYFPSNRPLHLHLQSLSPAFAGVFVNPVVITNYQLQLDLNGNFDPNIQVFQGFVGGTSSIFELQAPLDLLQLTVSPMYVVGQNDGEELNTGQSNEFPPTFCHIEVGVCLVPTDSQDPNDPNSCSANPTSGHMRQCPVTVQQTPTSGSSFIDQLLALISFFWIIVGACVAVLFIGCLCMLYQAGKLAQGIDVQSKRWCKPWCIRNCGCYDCKQYRKPEKIKADPLITATRALPGVLIVNEKAYDENFLKKRWKPHGGIEHDDDL